MHTTSAIRGLGRPLTHLNSRGCTVPQVRARSLGANLGAVGHTTFRTFRRVPGSGRLAVFGTCDPPQNALDSPVKIDS